jgi:hypothetical protein
MQYPAKEGPMQELGAVQRKSQLGVIQWKGHAGYRTLNQA